MKDKSLLWVFVTLPPKWNEFVIYRIPPSTFVTWDKKIIFGVVAQPNSRQSNSIVV
jgi:hypothetical protein